MSKITNNGLTRSGTGCFIAVPVWQQWASMVTPGQSDEVYHTSNTELCVARLSVEVGLSIRWSRVRIPAGA